MSAAPVTATATESTSAGASRPTSRNLGVREYLEALVNIVRSPAKFYASVDLDAGARKPMMFLFISAIFNASASMSYFFDNSLAMGMAFMVNALLMPVLAAVFTFVLAGLAPGSRMRFYDAITVHAYAFGAIMAVSWIPSLGGVMEIVRAVLVVVGLNKACGLGWIKSVLVVIGTAAMLLVFFWSLAPILAEIGQLLPS